MARKTMMQVQLGVPDPQPIEFTALMAFTADLLILIAGGITATMALVSLGA